MSSPAHPSSSAAPRPAPTTTDPALDAVESLYRGATGRSGLRAFEPALRPPEGTLDWGWLFRPDEPVAPVAAPLAAALTTTGSGLAVRTTTSGLAVVGPAPLVHWSPGTLPAARRWPAVALLAAALACAVLLPWVAPVL
ncbi:hypothetical protein ACFFOM_10570 [Microlunatus capsulatus]|uniref:Uncharacterized protein n=1 Tax=Microlunatus capsulatus TaxID=99117 RepID=A0ABS4Z9V1_9ACTN|nr:hypothetical protein [Microlunatus capsulatus]MBP2417819.1 hypothetical protein [Microlunatus capsulatus]